MTFPLRLARLAGLSVLAVAALALSACATMTVRSYVAPQTDFNRYRTYSWAAADVSSTGDPRLDNNTIFQERLKKDVERELNAKGLEKGSAGRTNLIVHYHVSITQRVELNGIDRNTADVNGTDRRMDECQDCRPFVFDAGTLVLDLVDARTNKLVWRGWAEDSVDDLLSDQPRMEKKIDEAVSRMMERLPI